MSNLELIKAHDEGTMFASFPHTMKSSSPTYELIIAKGKDILPDILKYLKDNNGGMSVMLLLWDITKISPYEPKRVDTSFGAFNVKEARKSWIEWGVKEKLI